MFQARQLILENGLILGTLEQYPQVGLHTWSLPLGTIKASQIVVLNEDMLLLLNKSSYK